MRMIRHSVRLVAALPELEVANASLLHAATAAAEAMTLLQRVHQPSRSAAPPGTAR